MTEFRRQRNILIKAKLEGANRQRFQIPPALSYPCLASGTELALRPLPTDMHIATHRANHLIWWFLKLLRVRPISTVAAIPDDVDMTQDARTHAEQGVTWIELLIHFENVGGNMFPPCVSPAVVRQSTRANLLPSNAR